MELVSGLRVRGGFRRARNRVLYDESKAQGSVNRIEAVGDIYQRDAKRSKDS